MHFQLLRVLIQKWRTLLSLPPTTWRKPTGGREKGVKEARKIGERRRMSKMWKNILKILGDKKGQGTHK